MASERLSPLEGIWWSLIKSTACKQLGAGWLALFKEVQGTLDPERGKLSFLPLAFPSTLDVTSPEVSPSGEAGVKSIYCTVSVFFPLFLIQKMADYTCSFVFCFRTYQYFLEIILYQVRALPPNCFFISQYVTVCMYHILCNRSPVRGHLSISNIL